MTFTYPQLLSNVYNITLLFVWTYWSDTVKLPRSVGLGNLWRIDVEQTSNYISENTDVDIIKWEGGGVW